MSGTNSSRADPPVLSLASDLELPLPYAPGDVTRRRSWWLEHVGRGHETQPALVGTTTADVCIAGGGFTGLWTAIQLKRTQPSLDVVLLEADRCGGGASGRNGGFVLSLWHHFLGLERLCGTAEAVRLGRESAAAVDEIGRFCAEYAPDAEFLRRGWLWAATNDEQAGAWRSTLAALDRAGESPFEELPAEEAAGRAGSPTHRAGIFEAVAASVQPARLVAGLHYAALRLGVRVFEHTPVGRLIVNANPTVVSPLGSVRAQRVVFAINAWSVGIPSVRRAIAVMGSDIVITPAIADRLDSLGLERGLRISDSRLMVNYYRRTADDRLAFGKGGSRLAYGRRVGRPFSGPSRRRPWLVGSLEAIYPPLAGVGVAMTWTGPIDRTYDGLPFFCALGLPNVFLGAGFSGNGVGPSFVGGRILASLALGADDAWSRCGLVRRPLRAYPPEPVRYLGGQLVRRAVARKEHAEDRGASVAVLDRKLAALAPSGLVPTE